MYKINLLISCSKNIDNRLLVRVELKMWVFFNFFFLRNKKWFFLCDLSL